MLSTKKSSSASGYRKKVWSAEDDAILLDQVSCVGPMNWNHMASFFPGRTAKQCRERWHNHLTNGIKKGDWTREEDRTLLMSHSRLGNQWTKISKVVPGRSTIDVKNRYYVLVRERKRGGNKQPSQLPPHIDTTKSSEFGDLNKTSRHPFTTASLDESLTTAESLLSLVTSNRELLNNQRGLIKVGFPTPERILNDDDKHSSSFEKIYERIKTEDFSKLSTMEIDGASETIPDYTLRRDVVNFYVFLKELLSRNTIV